MWVFFNIIKILCVILSSLQTRSSTNARFRDSSLDSEKGLGKGINIDGRRHSSSSSGPEDSPKKPSAKKHKTRTLSSPDAKPYPDLYKGRGKPKIEPDWVKDNGLERSPFGSSWAKPKEDRVPLPSNYFCNYTNIADPFNNRDIIKEICKGNRVVYIWTYLPTGVCLVGSSSNSVERVLSYFEKKYLFLDFRRGVQFLANWGFRDIQLTIITFPYHDFTIRDIKTVELHYINELNSSLNVLRTVYLPPITEKSVLPYVDITNRDTAVVIFVYGPDKKKVLYIFNSKTAFYAEFGIHHETLMQYLDNIEKKLFDYFIFTSKPLEGSDCSNPISLKELLEIKAKVDPKKPHRGQVVILTDLTTSKEYEFYSITKASEFIRDAEGTCDRGSLRAAMNKNAVYKARWVLKKIK